MNQHADLLLAAENLQRDSGLVRGEPVRGAFALKRPASQTYLVVNDLQARVLAEFAKPKSVPQVLEVCICERKCPALREFYDLILKAHAVGILRTEELCTGQPAYIERPAVRWFASIKPHFITVLFCLLSVASVGVVFWQREATLPVRPLDYLIGWLAACAGLSLGQVFSAAALRGAGCEVYRPHFRWATIAPHFAVDRADACMAGLLGRATIHAVTVVPLAITAALALWFRTPWSLFPLAALFFQCRPVGGSPVSRILQLFRRSPLLSTDGAQLFDAPMELSERLHLAWRRFDGAVASAKLVVSAGWAAGLACVVYRVLQLNVTEVFHNWSLWQTTLLILGATLGGIGLLWLASEIRTHAFGTVSSLWSRIRLVYDRLRPAPVPDIDGIERIIRRHPLLGNLDPIAQMELAACFKPFQASMWRTLVKFNEPSPFVGLIVSGKINLFRQLKSGRKSHFLHLIETDLFGAHQLFEQAGSGYEIRTGTPLVALTLDLPDFQRLVVDKLGHPAVTSYLQKHLFLQRSSSLCADWRPATIARFTDLVATTSHAAGGRIIARGQEVPNLYVLYEGRAQERSKRGGRINPGDFFGETSLLQTSAAPDDVESKDDSRSLVVSRLEFIRFMARNHHVALQMERLCSKRLGHPLFPLDRRHAVRKRAG
ncbi:MAG TPA: cyclic nucleotide-binding domain-containing protein [Candidatus Didemnitutus sp.]|nr:cyclic nucleotide-binding domain-containing protein [Candidatus Didemnitutus sp.]